MAFSILSRLTNCGPGKAGNCILEIQPLQISRKRMSAEPPISSYLRHSLFTAAGSLHLELSNATWQAKGKFWKFRQQPDRKSTRLNSSHANISYAVFCLKKKKIKNKNKKTKKQNKIKNLLEIYYCVAYMFNVTWNK